MVPVPPRATVKVPDVSERKIPREEVAKPKKVFPGPPINKDEEAIEVRPVPPYTTPSEVVATMVPFTSVVRSAEGIWKRVVEPMLLMEKRVEVAKDAEVEPMAKSVVVTD